MTSNKIQKQLNLTCQECFSVFELLEIHQQSPHPCKDSSCLTNWKALLHSHFQEQIILYLAQQEAQNNHDQK